MIRKICPCLTWFKKQPKGGAYNLGSQFEEEEFMKQLSEEVNKSQPTPTSVSTNMPQQISIEEQLALELNQSQQMKEEPLQQQKSKQDLVLVDQEPRSPAPPLAQTSQQNSEDLIDISYVAPKFQLNLEEYHQFYQAIRQATTDIDSLLSTSHDCTQISTPQDQSHPNKFRLWRKSTPQNERAYICTYQLPCSYAFYIKMTNKRHLPKDQNPFFYESRLVESIYPNLSTRYLCLNKINAVDKREFKYLKYTNGISNHHWEICTTHEGLAIENSHKAKTCPIQSVSLLIEENEENEQVLKIKTYLKTDLGIQIEKLWEKLYRQFQNYTGTLWNEAMNNYEEELV